MLDREQQLGETVAALRPDVRRFLLEAIMAADSDRAALIGRLHEQAATPALVELLIDLEADRISAWTWPKSSRTASTPGGSRACLRP
jgi:hypothetical protein